MSDDKARALVLADRLERGQATWGTCDEAAAELRRLHDEVERLAAASRSLGRQVLTAAISNAQTAAARVPLAFDLVAHLRRQIEFSARTFGPGDRTAGVCDHIRKELREVQDDAAAGKPTLPEWVDVIILGLDGAWRSGATPEQIVDAIVAKQAKNEGRKWPDWRTAPEDKAIEHDRSGESAGPEGGAA